MSGAGYQVGAAILFLLNGGVACAVFVEIPELLFKAWSQPHRVLRIAVIAALAGYFALGVWLVAAFSFDLFLMGVRP